MALGTNEIATYLAFAEQLADASGKAILPHFRQQMAVEDKGSRADGNGRYDPVTAADKAAEAAIRSLIKTHHPDHGIHGEEEGLEPGTSPLLWVIDPIDGTRAFITGMPLWGTLIALNDGTRPVLGVMATRPCASLAQAQVMATDPRMFTEPHTRAAFDAVEAKARMTRYGGDCYAYCMLAMGFVDLVIEGSLQPYDVQALIPIVEGAGGLFTSWTGGPADQGGLVVAAGDARVHAEALAILRPFIT